MSGKFTNMRYDREAYNEEIARSTDPLLYRINQNYAVNCSPCFAPYGPVESQGDAVVIGNKIDVDSILKGVNKVNTKINRLERPMPLDVYPTFIPGDCSNAMETQYTRYTNPAYEIKGLNSRDLRLDYPLFDPQCQIFENFEVNTRLQAKDNHRTVWQVPFNQSDLLPTERLGRVRNCTIGLNCN